MIKWAEIPECLANFHEETDRELMKLRGTAARSHYEIEEIIKYIALNVALKFTHNGLFLRTPQAEVHVSKDFHAIVDYTPEEIARAVCAWGRSEEVMDLWIKIQGTKDV